jgi:hypothetical protein
MKKLLWLFLTVLFPTAFALSSLAADPIGSVVGLQGSAQAIDAQGQSRVLQLKTEIYMKDSIRTEAGARVQIMFKDDSLFSVGENSEVLIDEYVFNPDKKEEISVVIRILRGIARVITGKATDLNPEKYTVKTGRSTIGIRGCDLGFEIGPDHDSIYLFRIPQGRSIRITPLNAQGGLMTSRFKDYTDSGILIQVWDNGRMKTLGITPDDLKRMGASTQPRTLSSPRRQETAFRSEAPFANTLVQDKVLVGHELVPPDEQPNDTNDSFPPPPPPPPRPDPKPIQPLSGGGISATYSGSSLLNLNNLTTYHVESGFIGLDLSDVHLIGREFDGAGNFVGYTARTLQDVPIMRSGSTTAYEGYNVHTDPNTGGMVANDNLGQFVRLSIADRQLLYWGVPSVNYANSRLPDNSVVNYDVLMATFPDTASLFPNPFQAIDQGTLRINTKTGVFSVKTMDGKVVYGPVATLRFYGQESQGIGMEGHNPTASAPQPSGMAIAGFRDPSLPPVAAESGTMNLRGYAAATAMQAPGANVRSYSSADAMSDSPLFNEERVSGLLNKDDPTLHSVTLNLNVFEDPSAASPGNQIHLGTPNESFYVQENEFGARHVINGQEIWTHTTHQGQDWTWGEWNGRMDVPTAGTPQQEDVHGEFVAGNTLLAGDFQALAAGAASYALHTPNPAASFASALVAQGNQSSILRGTCDLDIFIPGSGMTPTWNGDFILSGPGSESLNITVNPTSITPNGHLQGTPTTYLLNFRGNSYNQGTLSPGSIMDGNLVGPGTGPTPITGAIGSGQFVHNNGITVNMTYGTDLAP